MEGTTIIVAIIGALAGGGLSRLITVKESKKEKQLDNADHKQELELKLVNELQDQVEKLNDRLDKKDARITELEDANAALRMKLDEANTSLAKTLILKCSCLGCKSRIPPLGYSELTPEEMVRFNKEHAVEE